MPPAIDPGPHPAARASSLPFVLLAAALLVAAWLFQHHARAIASLPPEDQAPRPTLRRDLVA
jgi:hypothetical protein